jgi:hypothetical protein
VGLPDHDPVVVVNVCPCTAWPLTTGSAVLVGAAGDVTTAVGAELAEAEPRAFVAVTTDRTVCPTSPDPRGWRRVVAPAITTQFAPVLSQSSHLYLYDVGLFAHVPVVVVKVCPLTDDPLTTGAPVLTGASTLAAAAVDAPGTAAIAATASIAIKVLLLRVNIALSIGWGRGRCAGEPGRSVRGRPGVSGLSLGQGQPA